MPHILNDYEQACFDAFEEEVMEFLFEMHTFQRSIERHRHELIAGDLHASGHDDNDPTGIRDKAIALQQQEEAMMAADEGLSWVRNLVG